MVTRVEMDGWWSRVTRGHEMETWSTRVRARGTLVVHWRAETAPNDCRVGDAARRLSSDPHHAACAPPLSLDSSRGKNGWKSCTVYDRPIIGPVPVESVVSDPIYVAWTAGVGFLTIDRGENR